MRQGRWRPLDIGLFGFGGMPEHYTKVGLGAELVAQFIR